MKSSPKNSLFREQTEWKIIHHSISQKLNLKKLCFCFLLSFVFGLFPNITEAQDGWSGIWRANNQSHIHWYSSSWSSLMSKNTQLKTKGYRMIDIESHYKNRSQKFYAIWKKDNSESRAFKVVSGWSNFVTEKKEAQGNYTLIDLETYDFGGKQKFIGIWKKTKLSHSIGRFGQWNTLVSNYSEQKGKGYQIMDVELYKNVYGQTKIIALYHKTNASYKNKIYRHTSYEAFRSNRNNLATKGWLLIDYERVKIGSTTYYLSIFEKASGKYAFYSNIDYLSFRAHRRQKASENMELVDMEVHQTGSSSFSPPTVYDYKANATPDLCQTNPNFPKGVDKGTYCAPTSLSNGLCYLAKDGYPNLNKYGNSEADQIDMVVDLGSNTYTKTASTKGGTYLSELLNGMCKYISDNGYGYEKLEVRGWRNAGSKYSGKVTSTKPDIDFIKEGLLEKSIVLLNFGWYNTKGTLKYERGAGHWVTAVGYGIDENGKTDPNVIIIHDPSPRSGQNKSQQHVKLEKMKVGMLHGSYTNLPRGAGGYYKASGELEVKSGYEIGILDAVVVLRMD